MNINDKSLIYLHLAFDISEAGTEVSSHYL